MSRVIAILFLLLALAAPLHAQEAEGVWDRTDEPKETAKPKEAAKPVGIANPASVHCMDLGGRLEIRHQPDGGEYGVCIFDDGSECEEWALFRGQCARGDSLKEAELPTGERACLDAGGRLETRERGRGGELFGSYTACVLPGNRQCEADALAGGFCPKDGVDVTGLATPAAVYCAVLGGRYQATRTFPHVAFENEEGRCVFGNGAVCDVWELYRGQCRERFNDAVGGWRYLNYAAVGLRLGYPEYAVALAGEPADGRLLTLSVQLDRLADLPGDAPRGYGRRVSEDDARQLQSGIYGAPLDYAVSGSTALARFPGGPTAKVFAVLAREDACRPLFERRAVFYRGQTRIMLTLSADPAAMLARYPEYVAYDFPACGDGLGWKREETPAGERFWQDLSAGRLTGLAADWERTFKDILAGLDVSPEARP
jgi:putative hemolysin